MINLLLNPKFLIGLIMVLAATIYKAIDNFILSSSTFNNTDIGKRITPRIEANIAAAVEHTAAFEVSEGHKALFKLFSYILSASFVMILVIALLATALQRAGIDSDGIMKPMTAILAYPALLGVMGLCSYRWTFHHREVIRSNAKWFVVFGVLYYVAMIALVVSAAPRLPTYAETVAAASPMLLLVLIAYPAMLIILYGMAWAVLGAPFGLSAAILFVTSRTTRFLIRHYTRDRLIVIMWVARFIGYIGVVIMFITGWLSRS